MGFFSKLKKKLKGVVKLGIKTAPLWSSFVPGGSIAGKFLQGGGKFGKFARVATRVHGLTQKVRLTRHLAPGRVPTSRPGGWARMSNQLPSNPFLNGRFANTHMRRLQSMRGGSGVHYGRYPQQQLRRRPYPRRRVS